MDDLINLFLGSQKSLNLFGKEFKVESNRKSILIDGDPETGKTITGFDIIKSNPSEIFLYVDAFFNTNHETIENCIMFASNDIDMICEYIESVPHGTLGGIIVDGISNLTVNNESWDENELRYVTVMEYTKKLMSLCYKKDVIFIAMNTLNFKGNTSNYSKNMINHFDMYLTLKRALVGHKSIRVDMEIKKNNLYFDLGNCFNIIEME